MALYIKQNEPRTQLNSRVTADLAHRITKRSVENDDSQAATLLQGQKKTTSGGIFWAIIIGIVLIAAISYVMFIL